MHDIIKKIKEGFKLANIIEDKSKFFYNKILTLENVKQLAAIIIETVRRDAKEDAKYNFNFSVECSDNSEFKSDDIAIFENNSIITTKKIDEIFLYAAQKYNYDSSIRVKIIQNKYIYLNVVNSDTIWVKGVVERLSEYINSLPEQKNAMNTVFGFLHIPIMIGYGILAFKVLDFIFTYIIPLPPHSPDYKRPEIANTIEYLLTAPGLFKYFIKYLLIYIYGFIAGGWAVIGWLENKIKKMHPIIELQIGPENLQTEKNQRNTLNIIFYAVVIPLISTFIYDVIKQIVFHK
jgi:hypothetical protein